MVHLSIFLCIISVHQFYKNILTFIDLFENMVIIIVPNDTLSILSLFASYKDTISLLLALFL